MEPQSTVKIYFAPTAYICRIICRKGVNAPFFQCEDSLNEIFTITILCKILPSAFCFQCHCPKIFERGFVQEIASGFVFQNVRWLSTNWQKLVQLLNNIRQESISILGRTTGCSSLDLSCFVSIPPGKVKQVTDFVSTSFNCNKHNNHTLNNN